MLSWSLGPGLSEAEGTQPQLFSRGIHLTNGVGDSPRFAFTNCVISASKIASLYLFPPLQNVR